MKHIILAIIGVGIAVGIGFFLLSREAGNPNQTTGLTPTASPSGNITVTSPVPSATVAHTFTVTGTARTFEQNVQWRVRTIANVQLVSGFTTATAPDIGQFGPYSFVVTLANNVPSAVVLEVFESSAKDGSEINKVSVPLTVQ